MSDERAKWINELAGNYVESWVGEQVADEWQKEVVNLQHKIAELEAENQRLLKVKEAAEKMITEGYADSFSNWVCPSEYAFSVIRLSRRADISSTGGE